MLTVIKRDESREPYQLNKVLTVVEKAFLDNGSEFTPSIQKSLKNYFNKSFNPEEDKEIDVDDIHNAVEQFLMKYDYYDVGKSYILKRYDKAIDRAKDKHLAKEISKKLGATTSDAFNANVDSLSFGGRVGEINQMVLKDYALNYCMSNRSKNNHLNSEIYIHDLDSYANGMHNCLSVPFDDLLSKGFKCRQVDIRPANCINTAFQLIAVIFQCQSLEQFGGVSATHLDWTMVPYVRKSFYKHYKIGLEYLLDYTEDQIKEFGINDDMSIDDEKYLSEEKVYKYALKQTTKELNQAVEGLYHNLNSLQSRSGNQLPFSSINYGTCTLKEGQMVIRALLEGSIKGVGKFERTSIFPCGIFQYMKGVNDKPGTPNYDLYRLALESTSKRLYPNYANVDWSGNAGYDPNDPRTYFSTMGKRKLQLI